MSSLPSSLRFRFFIGSLAFLILLFGLLSYNNNRALSTFALETTRATIAQTSETLNLALVPYTNAKELSTLNDYLDGLVTGNELGIFYLALLDESGKTLVQSKSTPKVIPKQLLPLEDQIKTGVVHVAQKILLANNQVGILHFGLSTKLLDQISSKLLFQNSLLIVSGLLFISLILLAGGIRVGNQLMQLVLASQALASGNYKNRAPETGNNELSYLAQNFNLMVDAVAERNIALQESESKLKAMINNRSLLIGLLDPEGRVLSANQATLALNSGDPQQSLGRQFWDFDVFRNEAQTQQQLRLAIERGGQGQSSQFVLEYPTNAGQHYAEFSLQPVMDPQNQVTWLVAQAIDITARKKIEDDLAQATAEWSQAMDQFEDPIYLVDLEQKLVRANCAFYSLLGKKAEACLEQPIMQLLHPKHNHQDCPVCSARNNLQEAVFIIEVDSPHNLYGRPHEARLKLVRNALGEVSGILSSYYDLSHIRMVEERMRLSSSVFDNTAENIFITDIQGKVLDVNPAFTELMGYSREEVIGQNPSLWKSSQHEDVFYKDIWQSLNESGNWRGEIHNRCKDGTIIPEWGTISRVVDSSGNPTHYVAVFTDMTQIKQSEQKLDHLTHHDPLTGLPNRVLFQERLTQSISHARRHGAQLAVVFIDLDNFKTINESLGHAAGDSLLQHIAETLSDTVRVDDTVSRVGGDEFVILLEDIQSYNVANVAAKLSNALNNPLHIRDQEIVVTASLGIAIYPKDGDNPSLLIRNADAALYRAKEEGRNTYQFYTEEMTKQAFERVLLENRLRQAIEKDEFEIYLQPQIDLINNKMVGAEALIRWQHPELGMISPVKFIPLAEETGLIHPIGRWVLLASCIQARTWLDEGLEFGRISVNVAGPQIKRGELVQDVMMALQETGLSAEYIELEVTEGFIMKNPEFAIQQLQALRELGIYLSIDDFGTGYSSLSYLKQLPVHKLKIDQSFMRGIPDDPDDCAICDAIIAMGKSLGMNVIAEGVEHQEQVDFLTKAGCQQAQGYLFSKPVEAEQIEIQLKQDAPFTPPN